MNPIVRQIKPGIRKVKKGPTYSGFLVTLNSNQVNPQYIEPFRQSVLEFAQSDFSPYLKYIHRAPEPEKIRSIEIILPENAEPDYSLKKNKQIHIHFVVKILHNSMIQLDTKAIAAHFADVLDLPGVYVNSTFVKEQDIPKVLEYETRHIKHQRNKRVEENDTEREILQ